MDDDARPEEKPKKRKMAEATFAQLTALYLGDKRLNNHTDDTLASDRRALARWLKSLPAGTRYCDLDPEQPRNYLIAMQSRGVRYEDHPNRPPVEGALSPFTVRKEVNVLKAFGTWLKATKKLRDPFAALPRPKVPRKIVTVLEPEAVRALVDALNTNTGQGARRDRAHGLAPQGQGGPTEALPAPDAPHVRRALRDERRQPARPPEHPRALDAQDDHPLQPALGVDDERVLSPDRLASRLDGHHPPAAGVPAQRIVGNAKRAGLSSPALFV